MLDVVTLNQPSTLGWVRLPQTLAYYADDNYGTDGAYPHNARRMVEDAVAALDPVIDFSEYDCDGDGYVDNLFVIHAGLGAEYTGDPGDIWSHKWTTYNEPLVDGVKVSTYSTEPEYWETPGDMTVGVYAHEMGHVLGLPDLYDTDYSSAGVGCWSLMAFGSWNGFTYAGGDKPARFDAWCSTKLGWALPTVLTTPPALRSVPTVGTSRTGTVFQIYPSGMTSGEEYFLVENRQETGTDMALPGSGLLIWHVDESQTTNADEGHKLVDLEEAGGPMLDEGGDYRGGPYDPYPGWFDNRAFSDSTYPDASAYGGGLTGVEVSSISNSASVMQALMGRNPVPPSIDFIDPSSGPTAGGCPVTIYGAGFGGATAVTFGGTAASFSVDSANQITAYAPARATGTVDIRVTTPDGTSPNTSDDNFTYVSAAAITIDGAAVGGDLSPVGDADWFQFTVTSAGIYTIDITQGTLDDSYMYLYGPAGGSGTLIDEDDDGGDGLMSRITAALTPGVYLVKVEGYSPYNTGTYWIDVQTVTSSIPTITVDGAVVGGDISTEGDIDWFQFTVTTTANYRIDITQGTITDSYMYLYGPDSPGTLVEQDDDGGSGLMSRITHALTPGVYLVKVRAFSESDTGTYSIGVETFGPNVTGISPASGTTAGGTPVTITGVNLSSATAVTFGGTTASFTVDSADQITATAPAHAAGTVDVRVTDPEITSANSGSDDFTYVAPTRFEQTDAKTVYLGRWSTTGNAWSASGGSYASTEQPGAAAVVKFTGADVSLLVRTTAWYGKAKVTLDAGTADEEVDTIDLYSATTGWKVPLYAKAGLYAGEHTLTIECIGDKNGSSSGYAISLDAIDVVGTLSQAPTVAKVDDTEASCCFAPDWAHWDNSGYWAAYDDTYAYSDKDGYQMSFTFEGTFASWLACTSNTKGAAKVSLFAGTAEPGNLISTTEVDLYSPSTLWKQPVYSTGMLPDGTYVVVIECLYEKNPASYWYTIDVDRFDILGTAVAGDSPPPVPLTFQQDDAKITYLGGGWSTTSNASASGGSYASTSQPGAAAMIEFTGTEITPVFCTGPAYGEAKLTLDPGTPGEQSQTIDLYSASVGWKQTGLYTKTGLADTVHTLVIENVSSGGEPISLDALDVTGCLVQAPAATKIDDNDSSYFTYTPGIAAGASVSEWSRWDDSGYWAAYLDTYAYTDQDDFKASFTFDGTFASWLACTSNTKGKAEVRLYHDAAIEANLISETEVDLYSPSTKWKQPVYSTGLLTDGTYVVEIVCLYEKNPASWWYTINVDRFDTLPGEH